MTILGKMLVFVSLVFSFLACAWAVALYLNRIDYTDNPAAEGKPAGELVERKEALKDLDASFRRSVAVARNARRELASVEAGGTPSRANGRPAGRDWYEAQTDALVQPELAFNEDNTPKTTPRPLREVVLVKGQPKLDEKNYDRPSMKPAVDGENKALPPLRVLEEERKGVVYGKKDKGMPVPGIIESQKKNLELTQKDIQLTEDIIGTEDGSRKGLRRRLNDENAKYAEVLQEHERVQPLLINAAVDSQLILQRQELLHRRIDELRSKQGAPPR